ncbi:hypothetical protein AB1K62_14255 [Parasphingorhabdus sp. JC815]|uniref:hypothetical protein n=1 Tax=Parasphingorhabdus sp. JC815 TaxID=3232140 RepID=UPI00345A216F
MALFSGLIGTVLIFFYGVATLTEESAQQTIGTGVEDQEVSGRIKCHKILSKIGLGLLVVSFALQLFATISGGR